MNQVEYHDPEFRRHCCRSHNKYYKKRSRKSDTESPLESLPKENLSELNNKFSEILSCANRENITFKEKMRSVHIAYVLKGRRIVHQAVNDSDRCYVDGRYQTSMHAEMNVLRSLKKNKSFNLLVIRIEKGTGQLCESTPCDNCRQELLNRGFKTVYCSRSDGSIQKVRLDVPTYQTTAWKIVQRELRESRRSPSPPTSLESRRSPR
jgi:deoxycytidylate deaminase